MASRENPFIIELLLRAAFEASTPELRAKCMVSYYKYVMMCRKKPKLLWDLKDLASRLDAPTKKRKHSFLEHEYQHIDETVPSLASLSSAPSLSSFPNEVIERIIGFVLHDLNLIQQFQDIPVLMVSRRFLDIGLRHLLNQTQFTFRSSRVDRDFYADSAQLQWHNGNIILPSQHFFVEISQQARFYQSAGILSLRSLIDSSMPRLPDPLALITNVRFDIDLPPIRLYLPLPNPPPAVPPSFEQRRLTHPHFPALGTLEDRMRYLLEPNLTHERAEYHFGFLKDLPFKNLQLLEIGFKGAKFVSDSHNKAVGRWIGRYLRRIRVMAMAKIVGIMDHDLGWANMVADAMAGEMEPWIGNL